MEILDIWSRGEYVLLAIL